MTQQKNQRYLAELIGTFILVFIGCGSAVFAGEQIGTIGISAAFGIALMLLVYIFGSISGCHLNPAVTFGLVLSKHFDAKEAGPYICMQLIGAIFAGGLLFLVAHGAPQANAAGGLALTGFAEHSPTGCSLLAGAALEAIATGILVLTVLLTTLGATPAGFEGLAIGGVLFALHLICIPVTNASLNIARSLGVAVFYGGWALAQLWVFVVAHASGAVVATFLASRIAPKRLRSDAI